MRSIVHVLTLSALTLIAPTTPAVTVVQCKDKDGSVSFRERCPPDTEQVGTRKIAGVSRPDAEARMAETVRNSPVTLYIVPNCDACDLVRQQLQSRKLPFAEHNVAVDAARQDELKVVAGSLTVPAVTVGKQLLTGYNRAALDAALKNAGYPVNAPEEAPKP